MYINRAAGGASSIRRLTRPRPVTVPVPCGVSRFYRNIGPTGFQRPGSRRRTLSVRVSARPGREFPASAARFPWSARPCSVHPRKTIGGREFAQGRHWNHRRGCVVFPNVGTTSCPATRRDRARPIAQPARMPPVLRLPVLTEGAARAASRTRSGCARPIRACRSAVSPAAVRPRRRGQDGHPPAFRTGRERWPTRVAVKGVAGCRKTR